MPQKSLEGKSLWQTHLHFSGFGLQFIDQLMLLCLLLRVFITVNANHISCISNIAINKGLFLNYFVRNLLLKKIMRTEGRRCYHTEVYCVVAVGVRFQHLFVKRATVCFKNNYINIGLELSEYFRGVVN